MANEINEFGGNAQDLTSNTSRVSKELKDFGRTAFNDLSKLTGGASNAIESASEDVSKWNIGVYSSFSSITNYFGSSNSGTIRVVAQSVKGLL